MILCASLNISVGCRSVWLGGFFYYVLNCHLLLLNILIEGDLRADYSDGCNVSITQSHFHCDCDCFLLLNSYLLSFNVQFEKLPCEKCMKPSKWIFHENKKKPWKFVDTFGSDFCSEFTFDFVFVSFRRRILRMKIKWMLFVILS